MTDSGVADGVVVELRNLVEGEFRRRRNSSGSAGGGNDNIGVKKTIAFMEGFLLYAPPESLSTRRSGYEGNAPLRPVHTQIHLPLFLPASYQNVKSRREGRSGYVTLGPAPEPPGKPEPERKHETIGTGVGVGTEKDKAGADGKEKEGKGEEEVDLEKPDDRPPQNFWVDPPGYVDDVVWPRYVEDHAWLLIPQYEDGDGNGDGDESGARKDSEKLSLVERFGDGTRVREDVGVRVAPGKGEVGMEAVLRWAVGEVLGVLHG